MENNHYSFSPVQRHQLLVFIQCGDRAQGAISVQPQIGIKPKQPRWCPIGNKLSTTQNTVSPLSWNSITFHRFPDYIHLHVECKWSARIRRLQPTHTRSENGFRDTVMQRLRWKFHWISKHVWIQSNSSKNRTNQTESKATLQIQCIYSQQMTIKHDKLIWWQWLTQPQQMAPNQQNHLQHAHIGFTVINNLLIISHHIHLHAPELLMITTLESCTNLHRWSGARDGLPRSPGCLPG